jgi:hypothetical protein
VPVMPAVPERRPPNRFGDTSGQMTEGRDDRREHTPLRCPVPHTANTCWRRLSVWAGKMLQKEQLKFPPRLSLAPVIHRSKSVRYGCEILFLLQYFSIYPQNIIN